MNGKMIALLSPVQTLWN